MCVCATPVRISDRFLCSLALLSKICEVRWEAESFKKKAVDMTEGDRNLVPSRNTLNQQQVPVGLQTAL